MKTKPEMVTPSSSEVADEGQLLHSSGQGKRDQRTDCSRERKNLGECNGVGSKFGNILNEAKYQEF